jgi:mannose-6-phosphate isomerase
MTPDESFQAYPLLMKPHLVEKVWGGDKILKQLQPDVEVPAGANAEKIGESWILADHEDGRTEIANGSYAGQLFGDILRRFPSQMINRPSAEKFPLLIKFLDATDDLSVQVHPDDILAAEMTNGDRGKTECWLVLDAEPGAKIQYGLKPGVGSGELRRAVEENKITDALNFVPVQRGEFYMLPAGLVHALMSGVVICEVQQNSNTTYRFYDWDRKPERTLHIEESLKVTDYTPNLPSEQPRLGKAPAEGTTHQKFAENEFFCVETVLLAPGAKWSCPSNSKNGSTIVILDGLGSIKTHASEYIVGLGQCWFVPAAIENFTLSTTAESGLTALIATALE